ncbi:unnamed protein product [Rotaria sp. Silwood1]|nr:unnamed protein product [Rotaria sp. Silwood1]
MSVIVSLSLDNGIAWVEKSYAWGFFIYVYGQCPTNGHCNYGICSYGNCTCNTRYTGIWCDRCSDGYFGFPYCYNCSSDCANNGTCVNATCVCAEGFTGIRCTECQFNFYGPRCTNTTQLVSIQPTYVTDLSARDGINITLIGGHLYFSSLANVICLFQASTNWTVPAIIGNTSIVICRLSNYTQRTSVIISLSLDNGITWVEKSYSWGFSISVYGQCPTNGSCSRGQCHLGGCECSIGYDGFFCDQCDLNYFWLIRSWWWGWFETRECVSCSEQCRNNGTCANSTCICQHGFTGQACDRCEANRYGAHCLPYPVIQSVDPPLINDIGGINITLYGVNFNSSEYRGFRSCKFFPDTQRLNASITEAVIVNDSILICLIPVNQLVTTVQWFLRLMINGTEQDYSTFNLQLVNT